MSAPSPAVENLKKQAKYLLKRHREGYYPVCQRIRNGAARFRGSSDKDILASRLALHEAQEIVAKENGFESWNALKKGIATMSNVKDPTPETCSMITAFPMVFVASVTEAVTYYTEKLGFKVGYLWGDPPFYGMITRDGASLHLRHVCEHPIRHNEEDLLSTAIPVTNVKAPFLELQEKGVEFHQRLKPQPWGATDFVVKDPDGNLLCFASPPDSKTQQQSGEVTSDR